MFDLIGNVQCALGLCFGGEIWMKWLYQCVSLKRCSAYSAMKWTLRLCCPFQIHEFLFFSLSNERESKYRKNKWSGLMGAQMTAGEQSYIFWNLDQWQFTRETTYTEPHFKFYIIKKALTITHETNTVIQLILNEMTKSFPNRLTNEEILNFKSHFQSPFSIHIANYMQTFVSNLL